MKKKIEKELLLMVRKLLLQVLIGWAKPLYTSLVASTHQHCTPPPPKFVPFFHYTIFWHVLSYRYYFKVFFSKVLKTDYWLLHCSVYFLEEEPTTSICDKSNSAPTAAAPHCMNRRQAQCGLKYEKKCNLEKKKNTYLIKEFFKEKAMVPNEVKNFSFLSHYFSFWAAKKSTIVLVSSH